VTNPDHSVSLGRVRGAMVLLGLMVLVFIWAMHHFHNREVYSERLRTEGAEYLNLSVIIAQNIRQIADRARALSSIYRAEARPGGDASEELLRLLAGDPVFNRMSIYDRAGELRFASAAPRIERLPAAWIEQFNAAGGNEVIIPVALEQEGKQEASPRWQLPFLVPLGETEQVAPGIMLVELDVGYLLGLYQHMDLGQTGLIQLLDAHNQEYLRANSNGVVMDRNQLTTPPTDDVSGQFRATGAGGEYQSAYYRVPPHGLTVVVSKQLAEILSPYHAGRSRQYVINMLVSLVVILCILGMLKMVGRQQAALEDLQRSQRENELLIARLEEEHERSSRAASTDHLSGLYNRRQFLEVAGRSLLEQRSRRRLLAILFIDLDRFKSINDTLGHRIGDLLLQAVAGRINRLLEQGDLAARFGGDEFVVLLAGNRSEQDIINWVAVLTQHLSALYQLENNEVNTSPSIGIAICPRDSQDIDTLVRQADVAMYSAKRSGRGAYRFYDPSLNKVDVEEFHLEQSLKEALSQHQFVLHYQPQIALDDMAIVGYEALVRWQHPSFGLIYPDRFIPIAERSGFIIPLGKEVIELACAQLAVWARCDKQARLAVNVSALQLGEPDFSDFVLDALARHDLDADQLELEITETAVLEQEELAIASLERLRDAGLCISLDDFGKGYAGFAHLNALPISKLKIDRSLIAELANSHDDSPIVGSTIILARRLGLQVVGEGVETPEQVVYLRLAGCDLVQGYHFSRPLRAEQLADFEDAFVARSRECV